MVNVPLKSNLKRKKMKISILWKIHWEHHKTNQDKSNDSIHFEFNQLTSEQVEKNRFVHDDFQGVAQENDWRRNFDKRHNFRPYKFDTNQSKIRFKSL
jgi:hypothetical protein